MRRRYAGPTIFLALALIVSPFDGRGLVAAAPQENGARLNDGGSPSTPTSMGDVDPIVALADSLLEEDLPLSAGRLLAAELAVSGPAASPAAILGAARALDRARSWRTCPTPALAPHDGSTRDESVTGPCAARRTRWAPSRAREWPHEPEGFSGSADVPADGPGAHRADRRWQTSARSSLPCCYW